MSVLLTIRRIIMLPLMIITLLTTPAAVSSIKLLAITEIICVAVGLIAVLFLPNVHKRKEIKNEIKE